MHTIRRNAVSYAIRLSMNFTENFARAASFIYLYAVNGATDDKI
jgi:hypothetical protein